MKKCTSILFQQRVVGQFTRTSKVVALSKHTPNKQRKATPTQFLQFHVEIDQYVFFGADADIMDS